MKFNIYDYDKSYAMHCSTEEEAECFVEYLDSLGLKWRSGHEYTSDSHYIDYKEKICYYFTTGEYSDIDYALRNGYEVLEYKDFDWSDIDEIPEEEKKDFENFISEFEIV